MAQVQQVGVNDAENVDKNLEEFEDQLKDLPKNMRLFSLSLRSLYSDKQVGASSSTAKEINNLRDMTRQDALIYVKGVLPLSTQVVSSIKDFFEIYEELDQEEWEENLSDILEEVKGYRQCCNAIIGMHEDIMIPLKIRQDKAKVLVQKLGTLNVDFEKKRIEFQNSAKSTKEWASILYFVPGVNIIAYPLLNMSADKDTAKAIAEEQQIEVNKLAIIVVKEALIPALSAFIDGLSAVAGFFKIMEVELSSFKKKGDKAVSSAKTLHYRLMKKRAKEMKKNCTAFYAMIPEVRTDLMCIPNMPDDKNYIDKWLSEKQKEIAQKYAKGITGQLKTMMSFFVYGGPEQLMIEGNESDPDRQDRSTSPHFYHC